MHMAGEKIKERLKDVPVNVKAAVDDIINESVAEAVDMVPKRFGRSNRKLLK